MVLSLVLNILVLSLTSPILNAATTTNDINSVSTKMQGFGPGLNQNKQQTGFFKDAIYPYAGDFNATTYLGHSGYGSIDMNKGYNTYGDPIPDTKSGTIQTAKGGCADIGYPGSMCNGGYGNHVIIDHGSGYDSLYGHMIPGSIQVSQGQHVNKGAIIGYTGTSGNSTGPHLHCEIRHNNQSVPVLNYFYIPNVSGHQ